MRAESGKRFSANVMYPTKLRASYVNDEQLIAVQHLRPLSKWLNSKQ